MKYPHIAPAGSSAGGAGWQEAGTDIKRAVALMGSRIRSIRIGVQLAEIQRRQGTCDQALKTLSALCPDAPDAALVWQATANVLWTYGNATGARELYELALRSWSGAEDIDGVLAARIGLARCARMNYTKEGRAVLDAALAAAEGSRDIHLLADAHREEAAWALLTGDEERALTLATRAARVHQEIGDRYLTGLANVLRARALNARQDRTAAVALVRAQVDVASTIGSGELKMVAVIFLGQFMQRGVVVGTTEWTEAKELLLEALAEPWAEDPFTKAELLLPLAHLYTNSGEFDNAESHLKDYGLLYRALGGNKVAEANLLKAQARLDFAKNGGLSFRTLRHSFSNLRTLTKIKSDFKKAEKIYREAGLEPGALGVGEQISFINLLGAGRVPKPGKSFGHAKDALDRARENLLLAEIHVAAGRLKDALSTFRTAENEAIRASATTFAIAAAMRSAQVTHELGAHSSMVEHLRSAIGYAEKIRAAVVSGLARRNIANTLRGHYELALVLAAKVGDSELVIEVAERLRTERLAGLLRRNRDALPADLSQLLGELDRVNDALMSWEPGVLRTGSSDLLSDLSNRDQAELFAYLAELRSRLADRTNELFADTYGAEPFRTEHVQAVREHVLMLIPVHSDGEDGIVAVWRSPEGESACSITSMTEQLTELKNVLTRIDNLARLNLTDRDLAPVGNILPSKFLARLANSQEPIKLVVIPTGWLWAVPFAAIRLPESTGGATVLLDRADIVLAPSLRFLFALSNRTTTTRSASVVSWRDPDVEFAAEELDVLPGLHGGHTRLDDASQVRDAFVRGGDHWRTGLLAAHGNKEPGLAQAIILRGRASPLTAADFLDGDANPPRYLSFASCHSGFPDGDDHHEPLGLALAALTAGATHVISAHFEIAGGRGPITECLSRLYLAMTTDEDVPSALARILRHPAVRQPGVRLPLFEWAALTVIGSHATA